MRHGLDVVGYGWAVGKNGQDALAQGPASSPNPCRKIRAARLAGLEGGDGAGFDNNSPGLKDMIAGGAIGVLRRVLNVKKNY